MKAVKKAADYLIEQPQKAWADYKAFKKSMNSAVNEQIFERSFVYMSPDCANGEARNVATDSLVNDAGQHDAIAYDPSCPCHSVPRDWAKVTNYCKRLGIVPSHFQPNFTNSFLDWTLHQQPQDGAAKQEAIKVYQLEVSEKGGVLQGLRPQLPKAAA